MTPYFQDAKSVIYHGDCLSVAPSVGLCDACVCDPPYGLGFMGKHWDHGVPGKEFWEAIMQACKPGAHLLAFGGTRTFHRLACAIEDAGWEIRDTLMWVYGSGFPKSLDVSKALDNVAGVNRKVVGKYTPPNGQVWNLQQASDSGMEAAPGAFTASGRRTLDITAPTTEVAKSWHGWGTALKPAWEPIILARKPLSGTVANNVQEHGCGALNIDGCRVPANGDALRGGGCGSVCSEGWDRPWKHDDEHVAAHKAKCDANSEHAERLGRWPANLIHDGSNEVLAQFPQSAGQQADVKGNEPSHTGDENGNCYGVYGRIPQPKRGDVGSAARFFYCAKASKCDRDEGLGEFKLKTKRILNGGIPSAVNSDPKGMSGGGDRMAKNTHPTVKPTALMRYLCRLVTPPNGVILDPFMGSGSTGKAAILEGFRFVGIEKEMDYCKIASARIAAAKQEEQVSLPLSV